MANEATLVQQLEDRLFEATVADGTGIEKGTLMQLSSDPNTVTATSGVGDIFAGILAAEKVAGDGHTRAALWRRGVFAIKVAAGGSATLGKMLKTSGANCVVDATDDAVEDSSSIVGMALETGAAEETINVLVGAL